ncbi:MAG: lipocalin-like domain-containing protein, partial [Candidatus Tectimicrobiota bacterium]
MTSKTTSLVLVLLLAAGAQAAEWKAARPDYGWSFPTDHWARAGYRTEWWYFTGHLTTASAPQRRFGYQFTIFRVGLAVERPKLASAWSVTDLMMGHAAITDLATGRHRFSELLYRTVPFLGGFGRYPEPLIAWSRAPAGTDGTWTLRWNGEAFDVAMQDDRHGLAFALTTRPAKPLVFQGPNGFSRKGEGPNAASHYYSFTWLATEGSLTLDGTTFDVKGDSWMDKEFSSTRLAEHQAGWDWFSLQLDDGREIMLYLLRHKAGGVDFAQGTIVSQKGEARYLARGDWTVRATRTWTSPETGAAYPARWTVEIPDEGLRL